VDKILANALGDGAAHLAASEKQVLLSRLLERLAHEVRNPLSSLDIHLQLLEEDLGQWSPPLKEKAAPRLEIIHDELRRLESIVQQFVRLAGPSELNLELIDINKVVRHVCDLLQPGAATRGIVIAAEFAPELASFMGDADQLIQALINLVVNALQAVERNGRVDVRVRSEGDCCIIEVRDTGPGVPPDRLTAIFEPYYTTKSQGCGIGLWIVQQIATAHQGEVEAANIAGSGASLTMRLPMQRGAEAVQ